MRWKTAAAVAIGSPLGAGVEVKMPTATRYAYPWFISLPVRLLCLVFILFPALRYLQTIARLVLTTFPVVGQFLANSPVAAIATDLASQPVPVGELLAAHISVFLMIALGSLLYDLFPGFQVTADGLVVQLLGDRRVVPWQDIVSIASAEAGGQGRLVVFIRVARGLGLWSRLQGLLYGVGFAPGALVTTDISGFDNLLKDILVRTSLVSARGGRWVESERVMEDYFSPVFQMILAPKQALERVTVIDKGLATPRGATVAALFLALIPPTLYIFNASVNGRVPSIEGALVLFTIGCLEWVLSSLFIFGVLEIIGFYESFWRILTLYPYSQLPRLMLGFLASLFVVARLPLMYVGMVWVAGVIWGTLLAIALAKQITRLPVRRVIPSGFATYVLLLTVFVFYTIWR
ncbi:MAG: hypothetical protein HY871_08395 [Chloroflexi bacterium]|nr:hypothetical protein [Chloroflexota bacterium]